MVSMAPGGEISGIRTALAMGAVRAILASDDARAVWDALGTAKALAAVIERAEPDLIIAGTDRWTVLPERAGPGGGDPRPAGAELRQEGIGR